MRENGVESIAGIMRACQRAELVLRYIEKAGRFLINFC